MNQTLQDIQNNIEARNEAFKAMTMAERRVAVAKDVLNLLNCGFFDEETYDRLESYFENTDNEEYDDEGEWVNPGPSNLRAICNNIIENKGEFTLLD